MKCRRRLIKFRFQGTGLQLGHWSYFRFRFGAEVGSPLWRSRMVEQKCAKSARRALTCGDFCRPPFKSSPLCEVASISVSVLGDVCIQSQLEDKGRKQLCSTFGTEKKLLRVVNFTIYVLKSTGSCHLMILRRIWAKFKRGCPGAITPRCARRVCGFATHCQMPCKSPGSENIRNIHMYLATGIWKKDECMECIRTEIFDTTPVLDALRMKFSNQHNFPAAGFEDICLYFWQGPTFCASCAGGTGGDKRNKTSNPPSHNCSSGGGGYTPKDGCPCKGERHGSTVAMTTSMGEVSTIGRHSMG